MNEQQLQDVVLQVLTELGKQPRKSHPPAAPPEPRAAPVPSLESPVASPEPAGPSGAVLVDDDVVPDIRAVDYRKTLLVDDPANPEQFLRMKERTWARIGLGHSGPRYRTSALLRFLADNASAMDAVSADVSEDFLDRLGLFTVQTECTSKDEYLAKPHLGARFTDEALGTIRSRCRANPEVQVFVADGLSSTAVEANIAELLPSLEQGLKLHGLTMGTPFFVKYGRVRSMEPVSEALGATVTCILLGERPGLASAESLSSYIAYRATVGMSEAMRTCISNIHQGGTNPVEAGAHLADLISEMVRQQASGINLKV